MSKRIFDLLVATLTLVVLSPVLLIIALCIKLDSKGGVFYVQDRLGKNGRVFSMIKFRTMVENAEQSGTGLFSYADDDRITRVGRILRRTSLDETPQLFNVISGSMSAVGPRPPVTYELGDYKDMSVEYQQRFRVKPGITGLAQVSGRNDLTWDEKVLWDNRYIEHFSKWSILYDFAILIRTVWVVLFLKNTIEERAEDKD